MPAIGPSLPPRLTKRKRSSDNSIDGYSDAAEPTNRSPSPGESVVKKERVLGPSLPPAPICERPAEPALSNTSSSSDDDDDVGPALPPGPGEETVEESDLSDHRFILGYSAPVAEEKLQRETWMLEPPKHGDWTSKVDPTQLKSRKFNGGKGAKGPARQGASDNTWTETPEQKRRRLQDEVMGIRKPGSTGESNTAPPKGKREAVETARRIAEYDRRFRGKSLYEEHKQSTPKEKEDDPSARAFDREKDIAGGQKIGHAKRKELLGRAANFNDKFSGGNFL
ncbi:MAG: hypothetical protein M1814_005800 [Vezdaea aestivalis]|nr:MAG: hypothetical protein M1814_005800 [Vezdaea aestivalis]